MSRDDKTKDPVCGMDVNKEQSEHSLSHDGKEYHFCSEKCRDKFEKDPGKYMDSEDDAQEDEAKDPVCGMKVNPNEAEFQEERNNQTYYFCSEKCHDKFQENPEKYAESKCNNRLKTRACGA